MNQPSYTPGLKLKIDDQDAPKDLREDILQIFVEESLHLPGMFTIVIKNDYFPGSASDRPWKHQDRLEIGKSIEIGFVSSTTQDEEFADEHQGYVLKGEITGIETHFTNQSQAPIVIRGYDVAHRLHRGRYNRSFQNMTDTEILKKIAGEVGIPLDSQGVEQTAGPYGYGDINDSNGYIFQQNQTNMEFLRELSARNGFELFVRDGKLNFRKPQVDETLELEWLKDLYSFSVRVSSSEQVSSVEVRGWDYQNNQVLLSQKSSSTSAVITDNEYGQGKKTSTIFKGKPSDPKMIVVNQSIFDAKEGEKMAQALFDELSGEFVLADARSEGNPEIRPGKVVKLSNMGKYSGKYYITDTRHLYSEGTYATYFSVRGLRGGDLLKTLSPPTRLQPGNTHLVGIVTDNKDPKGWGRVRVKFPTLTPENDGSAHASYWARVIAVGAGKNRGLDCLPEIDDEVLVAFEHGNIHRPYVIGGVWNGQYAPPEKVDDTIVDGKVRLRTFKTRTGHTLQFVEEDKDSSKKGIYINTASGHQLHLSDSEKYAEVKTKEGHQVLLDDDNQKIEIKTSQGGQATITMKSSSGEINIKAGSKQTIDAQQIEISSTGTLKISSTGTVEISSTGTVTVKGSMIKLN
ncbi:MAG: VgrG-related protein [Prochloraceae cyanobacterium]